LKNKIKGEKMRIHITPETPEEINSFEEVVHENVTEFFICGRKNDADGDLRSFHDWRGGLRYLFETLGGFLEEIRVRHELDLKRNIDMENSPALKKQIQSEGGLRLVELENANDTEEVVGSVQTLTEDESDQSEKETPKKTFAKAGKHKKTSKKKKEEEAVFED
jgi:hypothetical protein